MHDRSTTPGGVLNQAEWDAWPKCAVPICENKCCLRLNSIYCWPHTPGTPGEAAENIIATESEEVEELFRE